MRPEDRITREEVASLLVNALDIEPVADATVDPADNSSKWAAGVLQAAKDAGIMQGDENGHMNGLDNATRAEVAVMIARAAKISSDDLTVLDKFSDASEIPGWAQSSIAGLVSQGKMNGYEDSTLRMNNLIIRAEAFQLLSGILAA